MKTLVGLTLVAAAMTLVPQTASAWCNFKFGVGLNMEWSSGNNSWFCGRLLNSGPYTGGFGDCGYGPDFAMGGFEGYGYAMNPAPAAAPVYAGQYGNYGTGQATPAPAYSYTGYQPAAYQYPSYNYPSAGGYYYTGYYGW